MPNRKERDACHIFASNGFLFIRVPGNEDVIYPLFDLARMVSYRVQPLADRIGISTRYLNALFISDLGMSAKLWLRQLRFTDAVRNWSVLRDLDEVTRMAGLSHRRELFREFSHFSGMPWRDFIACIEKSIFRDDCK